MNLNLDPFWRSSIGFDRVLDQPSNVFTHPSEVVSPRKQKVHRRLP
jgi:hypothetical protein